MSNNETVYDKAFKFLKQEQDPSSVEKGLAILRAEVEARPTDAKAWFELAGGFDFLGRESEALPHYEKAQSLGIENLPVEDRPRLFVQLGSTLRNLKRYDDAREILQDGISKFPQNSALKGFLALTEYSDGNYRKAARLFGQAMIFKDGDTSLRDYGRALQHYIGQIDTFPARQRHWMRLHICNFEEPNNIHAALPIRLDHAASIADLMDAAYRGTIDHAGETPEQCVLEMRDTIEGKYGPMIENASFAIWDNSVTVSASMVTFWKNKALLAYSMTRPSHQGKGLAKYLIQKSAFELKQAGYREFYLVVTEGNSPAVSLYQRIGFELLGPALPGRGVVDQGAESR